MKDGELKVGDLITMCEEAVWKAQWPDAIPSCGIVVHVPGQDDGPELVRVQWSDGGSLRTHVALLERLAKSKKNND